MSKRRRKRKQRRKALSVYDYTGHTLYWHGKALTSVTDKVALAPPTAQTVEAIGRAAIRKGDLVGIREDGTAYAVGEKPKPVCGNCRRYRGVGIVCSHYTRLYTPTSRDCAACEDWESE